MTAVVVHHLERSRSHRVLWLLEELGVSYELQHHLRNPETQLAPAELLALHPLGKAPIVTLADGTTLAESAAILEGLVDRFDGGHLRPAPGTEAFRRHRYFMHAAEGTFMPPLLLRLVTDKLKDESPLLARPITRAVAAAVDGKFTTRELELRLDFLEAELSSRPYLTGEDFGLADIQMSFPLEAAVQRAGLGPSRAALWDYLERLRRRDAFRAAVARGGPVL